MWGSNGIFGYMSKLKLYKWDETILMGMRDHLIGGMSIHLAAILV